MKDGMPAPVAVTIEVSLGLAFKGWKLSRVNFDTPEGAVRPTIQDASYPRAYTSTVKRESVSISFDVNRVGIPENFRIEKSSNPSLEAEVTAILQRWRFHPGMLAGNPIPVRGTFDFVN